MSVFLVLAFLFFIGSVSGWILELVFSNITSDHKKWINLGFCTGSYVPLYGFGLCILYMLASIERLNVIHNPILNKVTVILLMAVAMTLIEYVG